LINSPAAMPSLWYNRLIAFWKPEPQIEFRAGQNRIRAMKAAALRPNPSNGGDAEHIGCAGMAVAF